MQPVLTVSEMNAVDAEAARTTPLDVLVGRAGNAVAGAALSLLGGAYGRRVAVVAGPGNNGADGRVVAARLGRRGARVQVLDAADPGRLPPCDLVVDAAYGTGFRGTYDAPEVPPGTPVLAVDIPSGVDGDTGQAGGRPLAATMTVTFAALKPGLLQGDGPGLAGEVRVAEIGVRAAEPGAALVEDGDVERLVPPRSRDGHKWASAVCVVAGSPGMEGAANFSARGASHAGAGMVRLAVPGGRAPDGRGSRPGPWPLEAVRLSLDDDGWSGPVLEVLERCGALVVGPGLGRDEATQAEIRRLVAQSPVPVVADADALVALGDAASARALVQARDDRPVVLTPHDGEYRGLAGHPPGPDRLAAARSLAAATGAVVLVKGPLTAVADPSGPVAAAPDVLLAAAGTSRLATAGTGDVLSGIIGALVARGVPAHQAAALGAHVHGRAASLGPAEGLVAGDLPDLVAAWLSGRREGDGRAG